MHLQGLGNETGFEVALSALVLPLGKPEGDLVVDHVEDDNLNSIDGRAQRPNTFVEERVRVDDLAEVVSEVENSSHGAKHDAQDQEGNQVSNSLAEAT